jgi:single-stranded-DNA-specific exonuclease
LYEVTDLLWRSTIFDTARVSELAKELEIPRRIARWLCLRGIDTFREGQTWLDVKMPWTLPVDFFQMEQAVQKLWTAVKKHERIAIIGDYDVDGVTSSAIVASTLRALHADWICIIPHRITDGYGISNALVDRALEQGVKLVVTVDNGIRAEEAVAYAVAQGIEVIVTDHHEPANDLPERASAIVHWLYHANPEAARHLSGAGVAWKLCERLMEVTMLSNPEREALTKMHLGFAALGALADIMPLGGENRRLVREGLSALKSLKNPGWLALCDVSRVTAGQLNATTVLWRITPRLNAAGRMDTAKIAFDLLMAEDNEQAVMLAREVEACNEARRSETERVASEAKAMWETFASQHESPGGVVVAGPWNLGVVGIVANKLVEEFALPAIVLSDSGEGILRGSGRAPEGFSLYEALELCEPFLDHFGGHASAIGCGVERERLEAFRTAFSEVAASRSKLQTEEPPAFETIADDYLPLSLVTLETVDWIERFEPFGPGNPEFVFYVGPVEIRQIVPLSGGKHARLVVAEGVHTAELVWFQVPERVLAWKVGAACSLTAKLSVNIWQGTRRPQLVVQDGWLLDRPLVRKHFAVLYRELRERKILSKNDCEVFSEKHQIPDIQALMAVFVELGFAHLTGSAYHVVNEVISCDLREAKTYQIYLHEQHQSHKDDSKIEGTATFFKERDNGF